MNKHVHSNSVASWRAWSYSDLPSTLEATLLSFLDNADKPLTFDEIAEGTGIDLHYMGQLVGVQLIKERKLVFELYEVGISSKGNPCKLVVSRKYLKNNPECSAVYNDPRGLPLPVEINNQLSLFE